MDDWRELTVNHLIDHDRYKFDVRREQMSDRVVLRIDNGA